MQNLELAKERIWALMDKLFPDVGVNFWEILLSSIQVFLLALMFGIFAFTIYLMLDEINKEKKMLNLKRKRQSKIVTFLNRLFSKLNTNIGLYMKEKGKSVESSNRITTIIIVSIFAFGSFLIAVGQLFFAITLPIILLIAINHIVVDLRTTFSEALKNAMPDSVNGVLRTFSKQSDLQVVLYETSKFSRNPMKTILDDMARRMVSTSNDIVIRETMSKHNNTWLHSFLFIILSYAEGSSKEEVVSNLRALRDIVDKENKTKTSEKLERKMSVTINYVLCVIALIAAAGNIIFNPGAIDFYFSTPLGLLCFFGSFILIAATIFSNIFIAKGGND